MADAVRINRGDEFPIKIEQDRIFSRTFYFVDTDGTTAIDLTGYTSKAEMRDINGNLLLTFTCTVTAATGKIVVSADDSLTALVTQSGYWDLVIVDASGDRGLVSRSPATLITRITQ
jgi:hypothetical protein